MTLQMLRDARVWIDEYDATDGASSISVAGSRPEVEITDFNSAGWREYLAGIKSVDWSAKTFLDPTVSDAIVADIDAQSSAIVIFSADDAAGSVAYLTYGNILQSTRSFPVGEVPLLEMSGKAVGSPGLTRGWLLLPKTTATATANSTAIQLGAISASQTIYASLHVFSASASDTLDVKIQSDTVGFPSATDRITFTQATAAGAELKSLAGPITDDYWRVSYTIAGAATSFDFAVVFTVA